MPNLKSKFKHGFNLIELLTVITIIAILVSVVTVSWSAAQKKARDGKRKSDLKAVQQSLELYFQDNGTYPFGQPILPNPGKIYCLIGGVIVGPIEWGNKFECDIDPDPFDVNDVTYMNPLPIDQNSGSPYSYNHTDGEGNIVLAYILQATLENANDPEYCVSESTTDCQGRGILPCEPEPGYNYCVINP